MNVLSQKVEEKEKEKIQKKEKIKSLNMKLLKTKINKYSRLIPLLLVVFLSMLSIFFIPDYVQNNDFGTYISNLGIEENNKLNTDINNIRQLDNSSINSNDKTDLGTNILNMSLLYLVSIILFFSSIIYIWIFGKKVNLRIDMLTREIDYQKRYDT